MNYSLIKWRDIADGPGIRVSLFVSGCRHHCKGCFNPETWDFQYGKPFGPEQETEILNHLSKPYIKGLSLLGGEPFHPKNQQAVLGLVQIPCIERNAYAAARAMDANSYAMLTDGAHQVSFDKVVEVMKKTGHDLPSLYKETGEGGLAEDYKRMWDTLHTR